MSQTPTSSQAVYRIVAGLIRRGDEILLVQQQGKDDLHPTWALPGGVVEPGETFWDALRREVAEETGLQVGLIGESVYTVCHLDSKGKEETRIDVLEVKQWEGSIQSQDPGQLILDVRFVPIQDAIELLEALPWRSMREPIVAYLKSEAPPGGTWSYHQMSSEDEELLNRSDV